jgi:hypothetical protein
MIAYCPKLKTFISKPVSLGMTTSKKLKEMNANESPRIAMQLLINEEVNLFDLFPCFSLLFFILNLKRKKQLLHIGV